MVVKNISAIGPSGNIKPIPIFHAIPPSGSAIIKVVVEANSEEIDLTNLIVKATFNIGVTKTIGDFTITFLDPIKTNYNLLSNFDDVYVYADYGDEATTKRHRFKIEDKGYVDYNTVISGRGIGMILSEKSIIYQSNDDDGNLISKARSTILQEIIEQNFSEITDFSEIETDSTTIERNYAEIPFFDIVEELCGNSRYFYLDKDLIPHYFTKGSVKNTTEAVSKGNLINISNNSDNAEEIYTRVRVYGNSESNIPIIYTKDIGTTNTKGISKDYVINNPSITTTTQADEIANSYSEVLTDSTRLGDLTSLFLPNLNPGESFFIGLPDYNLNPGYYNIQEFSINIDNNGDFPFTTTFNIEKKKANVPLVIKEIVQTQAESTENSNPYDLDYSRIITFETDIGTHSSTTINEEYLKVSSGNTGTWISPIYTLDSNLTKIHLKWSGDDLIKEYQITSSQLWFSLNGGNTWKAYAVGDNIISSGEVPSGRDLRIKIVLNNSDAQIKRIGVYYNY